MSRAGARKLSNTQIYVRVFGEAAGLHATHAQEGFKHEGPLKRSLICCHARRLVCFYGLKNS